ncbi:hypothetical protein FBU31_001330 [Coemansia sp. 'formosensis']|nr:hypothetical protein FBU31_001330 [Coemansia sp. 'formosensis']
MTFAAGHQPGFVLNASHQLSPQASSSPSTAYPLHIVATAGSFYGHYHPAVPEDRALYHQKQYYHASAATGTFHPGTAKASSAEEREKKRRDSHSAMERRRRERTNNVLDELKDLIPWLRDEARLQKLDILEHCVSYIKELQGQVRYLPHAGNNKRRRLESRSLSMESSCANFDENSGEHISDDCDGGHVHRGSPPSLGGRRRSSGSNTRNNCYLQQEHAAAVTHTHAVAPACPHGQPTESPASPDAYAAAAAAAAVDAAAAALPLPLFSSTPGPRPCTLADVPAEYWNVDSLPSGDMPGLMSAESNASSKASSTFSTFAPSRAPLSLVDDVGTCDNNLTLVDGVPPVKNSIDFLTS